ncbi:hypothetical protein [Nitrospirillum amazonense]|uniref:hypothetical protein n=1 Tax=Nitrospirillum amazonense TaxID=28077 RepID=UPI0011A9B817|nr:hypothetical protein [Nitrospirillum amazonense]
MTGDVSRTGPLEGTIYTNNGGLFTEPAQTSVVFSEEKGDLIANFRWGKVDLIINNPNVGYVCWFTRVQDPELTFKKLANGRRSCVFLFHSVNTYNWHSDNPGNVPPGLPLIVTVSGPQGALFSETVYWPIAPEDCFIRQQVPLPSFNGFPDPLVDAKNATFQVGSTIWRHNDNNRCQPGDDH